MKLWDDVAAQGCTASFMADQKDTVCPLLQDTASMQKEVRGEKSSQHFLTLSTKPNSVTLFKRQSALQNVLQKALSAPTDSSESGQHSATQSVQASAACALQSRVSADTCEAGLTQVWEVPERLRGQVFRGFLGRFRSA